jgi:hypothetical protein
MSNVFVQQPAVQKLLRDSAGLNVAGGDERFKAIIHRLLENICTLIDDYNVTEEEFWHAVNYLHELGGRQEAALLAAGLGLEHFLDLRQDAIDAAAHRETGTRAPSKGRCTWPMRRWPRVTPAWMMAPMPGSDVAARSGQRYRGPAGGQRHC